MVRQSKQTTEEKNKKKTQQQDKPSPKKPSDSTIWPCKINGCNKQFAREADLKRHQRTTKLHSVPGFACPQCDARFTRTDALRRHQKSRHNGLVIEPTEQVDRRTSMCSEDHPSTGSRSKSRSRTPSSKGNPTTPNSVPPGGYYRQHTFAGVIVPPGMVGEGHYAQALGLPASATRLHQASWQPAPPWVGDSSHPSPHVIHPGYAHPYYNAPPQYYRPTTIMQSPDVVTNEQVQGSSSNGESSSSRNSSPLVVVDPSLDHAGMDDPPQIGDTDTTVIDPSLVSPSGSSVDNEDSSADDQASRMAYTKHISSLGACQPPHDGESSSDGETTIIQHLLSPSDDDPFPSHHTTHLEHPLELEQILTEDGEPMLNPAELLTQESLASPPPS